MLKKKEFITVNDLVNYFPDLGSAKLGGYFKAFVKEGKLMVAKSEGHKNYYKLKDIDSILNDILMNQILPKLDKIKEAMERDTCKPIIIDGKLYLEKLEVIPLELEGKILNVEVDKINDKWVLKVKRRERL